LKADRRFGAWVALALALLMLLPATAFADSDWWYTGIFVDTKPKKLEYRVGDKFDPTDMVVTANQTNEGKTEKVKLPHSMLSYSPSKFTKSGKQEVKVSVKLSDKKGKTKTFSDILYNVQQQVESFR